jgi:hypothetical protein
MQEKKPLNINQTDKKVRTLAKADLEDNQYHQAIKAAAHYLAMLGFLDYKYHAQAGAGTCFFKSADGDVISVSPDDVSAVII